MAHSALSIANAFLDLAEKDGEKLTPMKLQKLVYFAHGWLLGWKQTALIDEQVEAWRFGPVIRSVYHEFKEFGNSEIRGRATELKWIPGEKLTFSLSKVPTPEDAETNEFLRSIWDAYKKYSAIELSNMTHAEGTPWRQIWRPDLPLNTDIPIEVIQQHFASKIERPVEASA